MPSDAYYRRTRRDIETLLPADPGRVLEVGCGGGDTLRWLKERHPAVTTTGVEYNPAMLAALERNADQAFVGGIEDIMPQLAVYDTILCLDVLEHLPDSDAVLAGLTRHLAPGGSFIVSLPNVSHLSVSLPLLFRRRFAYADAGILDRTHLRFFTEASVITCMSAAGLRIEDGRLSGLQGVRARWANRLTFGLLRHHFTKQYLFRARPGSGPQPAIDWTAL